MEVTALLWQNCRSAVNRLKTRKNSTHVEKKSSQHNPVTLARTLPYRRVSPRSLPMADKPTVHDLNIM